VFGVAGACQKMTKRDPAASTSLDPDRRPGSQLSDIGKIIAANVI
jgi:hypothetical protein